MKKVFCGGSISCKVLPLEVTTALDKIVEINLQVLVGDANGVDVLIQKYLAEKQYKNVCVYHMARGLRSCLDYGWVRKPVASVKGSRTAWTPKDVVMRNDCDYGLFVWDSKSKGTAENMEDLKRQAKGYRVFLV